MVIYSGGDDLTMSYFDNFDNEFLNKYEKNRKNRKNLIDMLFYLYVDGDSNFM
jgi:hypothetical protein